jgi:hypothetical protein
MVKVCMGCTSNDVSGGARCNLCVGAPGMHAASPIAGQGLETNMKTNVSPKPRAKYLGEETTHPIEHAEDVVDVEHTDELVDMPPHQPSPDVRAEEPFGETRGTTETST